MSSVLRMEYIGNYVDRHYSDLCPYRPVQCQNSDYRNQLGLDWDFTAETQCTAVIRSCMWPLVGPSWQSDCSPYYGLPNGPIKVGSRWGQRHPQEANIGSVPATQSQPGLTQAYKPPISTPSNTTTPQGNTQKIPTYYTHNYASSVVEQTLRGPTDY